MFLPRSICCFNLQPSSGASAEQIQLLLFIIIIIRLYFQAHMQVTTKAQRTHSIALYS